MLFDSFYTKGIPKELWVLGYGLCEVRNEICEGTGCMVHLQVAWSILLIIRRVHYVAKKEAAKKQPPDLSTQNKKTTQALSFL